jgi:DNA-binding MarR family transcriptional regulator
LNWLNAGAVCLNFHLRRTARAVTAYYDEALKPTGVKITQFSILMAIASKGESGITEVARLAQCDRTTLTRSLKILESDKLIEIKKAPPGNGRRLTITAAGVKKMKQVYPYWFRAQRGLARALTPVKTRSLRHLLGEAKTAAEGRHAI